MKAYENLDFLHSPDARIVRILCEFMEPQQRLRAQKIRDTVVFFGSARSLSSKDAQKALDEISNQIDKTTEPSVEQLAELDRAQKKMRLCRYHDDAITLAKKMTQWSMKLPESSKRFLVCSGGGPGMMEAANQGAVEAGGDTVGFTISMPKGLEKPNPYLSDELNFTFHYFFMRKYWFAYLAKALVILPGGFGTLDELMEVLTLIQTGKIKKELPIIIYGKEYWNDIMNLEKLVEWGTISPSDLEMVRFCDDPDEAFEYLTSELTRLYL